jgi:hypothetical protein
MLGQDMDEVVKARVESVVELSDSIIKEIIKTTHIHGFNDPYLSHVVVAAVAMSIGRVDSVAPGFRKAILKMLEHDEQSE